MSRLLIMVVSNKKVPIIAMEVRDASSNNNNNNNNNGSLNSNNYNRVHPIAEDGSIGDVQSNQLHEQVRRSRRSLGCHSKIMITLNH